MNTITLLKRRFVTPTLCVLTFTKPAGFEFKSGQFARLGLLLDEQHDPVIRAYSIASAPQASTLDFMVTIVPNGQLSPRLAQLPIGAEVLLDGPAQGSLTHERIPGGQTLWLFATGTGLAPFASMLADPAVRSQRKDIILIQSVRTADEATLVHELAQAHPDVKVLVAVTRDDQAKPETAHFMTRIPDLIASGELEASTGRPIDAEHARVLLCGNPDFIQSMRDTLKAKGLQSPRFGKPGQLVVENFW